MRTERRRARRVAAQQLAAVPVGQRQHAAREGLEPRGIGTRQAEGEEEAARRRARGREVGQIDRKRLVTDGRRVASGQEVPTLDQHVRGHREQAFAGVEQRAVVAHAGDRQAVAARRASEEASDEFEFGHANSGVGMAVAARTRRPSD